MAVKKDKKTRRLARKRKMQRRPQPSGQQALLKCLRSSERLKDAEVVMNAGETERMSDVVLRFADPSLHDTQGVIDKNAIRFAIAVWNASLLPKHEHTEALKSVVDILPADDKAASRELVAIFMLLARKRKYFASNTRVMLDYQLTEGGDMLNLDVVSTLPWDDTPEP